MRRYRFAPAGAAGEQRLDQFVAERDPELTRSQVKKLIEAGRVEIDGAAARKPGRLLRAGEEVVVTVPPPAPARAAPEDIPLTVLYEDSHLIAIDKPAGLVVHPAAGHAGGTLVNALLAHCHDLAGIGGELRPGIVHRLDKDTSGVLVATKDDATHLALAARFKAHDLVREYLAVVSPPPAAAAGAFRTLYGRHPIHRKRFSSKVARGKPAVTHFTVEERFGDRAALVRCRLETGRTHQIRVHFADHGMAVVGDPVYGKKPRDAALAAAADALGRQALHAVRLDIVHPATGELLRLSSPLPADIEALLRALRSGVLKDAR